MLTKYLERRWSASEFINKFIELEEMNKNETITYSVNKLMSI